MAQSHFSLIWERYQANICSNFSTLQQSGEFVDLTLAADGHLVKVHQLVLGAASPYIKQLIQSAPCQHPVIFLNDVSHSTLCSILQYVYTGEVAIAEENLSAFFEASKALHIQGLDGMDPSNEGIGEVVLNSESETKDQLLSGMKIQVASDDTSSEKLQEVTLPLAAKNIRMSGQVEQLLNPAQGIKRKLPVVRIDPKRLHSVDASGITVTSSDTIDESFGEDNPAEGSNLGSSASNFELTRLVEMSPTSYANSKELQYTVSNRGSLQLILNRYMYNLFSKSSGGQMRRWRCVDYRDHKCPACTVTNGNVVVQRTRLHNHPYHDKKILGKIEKKAVYSAIKAVGIRSEDSQT